VLKSLVAAGEIFPSRSGWTRKPVSELNTLRVRTVQDAVARRTQQLTGGACSLLTCAAVAGRRLDLHLLQQVSGLPQADLLPHIKELIAAQMLVEEASEQLAFRHALTRQSIVGSLLGAERRALHARLVAAIGAVYTDTLEAHTPDPAHHSFEAGLWPQALRYSRAAGQDALRQYAPYAAIEHLTHALKAARYLEPPVPAALYFARAQAYQLVGVFEPALGDLEAALQASRSAGDRRAEWVALLDMGLLWTSRDYAQAERQLRQALELARTLGDPTALGHSLNRLGSYVTNLDRPEEALAYPREALQIFDQLQNQRGLAETHDLTGTALGAWGDWTKAAAHYQQAEALFRAIDDRQGLASSLSMSSFRGGGYLNDSVPVPAAPAAAQSDAQAALNLARQTGQRAAEAMAASALAFCLGPQGEYHRALELAHQGLALAEEIEHRHWTCFGRLALGALQRDLLEVDRALEQLEQARALAGELGSLFFFRMAGAYLISAYTLAGELRKAQTVFDTTLDAGLPPRSGMQRQVWASRADLALAQAQPELAL
jgi:tetratricopeptide (TPR) repeat protein